MKILQKKKRLLLFNIKILLLKKIFPKLVKPKALVFLIQLLGKINIKFSQAHNSKEGILFQGQHGGKKQHKSGVILCTRSLSSQKFYSKSF